VTVRPSPPVDRLLAPFREFANASASSGILLMAAAAIAMVWANSQWADVYVSLWSTELGVEVGSLEVSASLLHWVNDGLMAIFFLVVGLEIRRELQVGELASRRRAVLPVAAAIGGAILPAVIFLLVVGTDGDVARGWGIPMATDIAFALGVLALLGSRAPLGLRIFITALAIADDLLAVLVIAVAYTDHLNWVALAVAAAVFGVLMVGGRIGVRRPLFYGTLGIVLWLAVFQSGVHATVAGVLLALTIPSTTRLDADAYVKAAREHIDDFDRRTAPGEVAATAHQHAALWELEASTEHAQAPMLRFEHTLHPWVAFLIVPLFALANAGVSLTGGLVAMILDPVAIGVIVGLVVGKQVGITLTSYAVVRAGLADLPSGVTWAHLYGAGWLGGIGFTMSLFIAALAYGEGSEHLAHAKVGILTASVIAGIGGTVVLWLLSRRQSAATAPEPA
jgi:NhaA family Na+:H+ antiporter